MKDLDRFKRLIEEYRPHAMTPLDPVSPLSSVMQAERDGIGKKFLRGIYVHGSLEHVVDALPEVAGIMSPRSILEELENIASLEEAGLRHSEEP
jgi:hypothetical protein